jgi:hypothetical protein
MVEDHAVPAEAVKIGSYGTVRRITVSARRNRAPHPLTVYRRMTGSHNGAGGLGG